VRLRYGVTLALAFTMLAAILECPAQPRRTHVTVISSRTALPIATSGDQTIVIKFINPLRYQYSLQVSSTNITAPAPPSVIAPAATTGGVFPSPPPPPPPPSTSTAVATPKKETPDDKWNEILQKLDKIRPAVVGEKQQTDSLLFGVGLESQCYKDRLAFYSSPLLDDKSADSLRAFVVNNRTPVTSSGGPASASVSCRGIDGVWPFRELQSIEADIYSLQSDIFDMMTLDGFKDWKDKNADVYAAVTTLVANLLTQVQSLESDSDVAKSFHAAQVYNNFWRLRIEQIAQTEGQVAEADATLQKEPARGDLKAAALAAHQRSAMEFTVTVNCATNWYGRGRVDTITLHYTDVSASSPTDQSSQIAINSCLTPATVSTGIGMSFLRNQQFGFVSGHDPINPANVISVIGATTDQQVTPLYALQYNIAIKDFAGIGLQAAIGAALGSSSGTANIELIAGPSISIKRRAFFITPAFQLGRRDHLLPGFKVGDPQGTLTAIPVESSWKPGFALTFTFSVAQ